MHKVQSTPPSAPSETTRLAPSAAAAVTPTGPPANSRKRRLRLSPAAMNGNDASAGTANGEATIGQENETAT